MNETQDFSTAPPLAEPFDRRCLPLALDVVAQAIGCQRVRAARISPELDSIQDLDALGTHLEDASFCSARVADLRIDDVASLASAGVNLLAPISGGWLVATARNSFVIRGSAQYHVSLRPRRLERVVESKSLRCLVIESSAHFMRLGHAAIGSKSPWRRLWAMMRLESRDLWLLCGYAVILGGFSLAIPIAVQVLVNTIALGSLMQPLVVTSILLFVVLLFVGVVHVAETYTVEILARRIFVNLGETFTRIFLGVEYAKRDHYDLRDLANRFFEVVTIQKAAAKILLDALGLMLQSAVGLLLLGFYHPTLLIFDVSLLLALALVVALGNQAVPSAIAESNAKYQFAARLQSMAENSELFKRTSAASVALELSEFAVRDYLHARGRHYRKVLAQLSTSVLIQAVAMVALLGVGGWLVMKEQLTLGQLVAAELVVGSVAGGFVKLSKYFEASYDLLAGLDKIGKVLDLPLESRKTGNLHTALHLKIENLAIESERGSTTSSIFALKLKPGARCHLEGDGRHDRSRVLETLAGLRVPHVGSFEMRDESGNVVPLSSLRDHAFLLRCNEVFSASIRDLLRTGKPDADDGVLWQVLHRVGMRDVVEKLPGQLDEVLLGHGAPLSMHEINRLSLARALLAKPALLLVDHAFDHLGYADSELASRIEDALLSLSTTTVIVATHSPSLKAFFHDSICLSEEGSNHG
jgi:ABC-type bacteriocin/lantibiotic exporter with double-glycine peptidase domain